MADEQFINQINGPKYIVNNEQENRMIVMPAYHQGIDAQNKIYNTSIPFFHVKYFNYLPINLNRQLKVAILFIVNDLSATI